MDVKKQANSIRGRMASAPETSKEDLIELANDPLVWIRANVAANLNTPINTLRELSEWGDRYIRQNVAGNPNTPLDILIDFSKNADTEGIISINPSTPEYIKKDLVKSPETVTRYAIVNSHLSSGTLLVMLLEHERTLIKPDPMVIHRLYTNENLPAFAKRVIETLFKEMLL